MHLQTLAFHCWSCAGSASWAVVVAGVPCWRASGELYFEVEVCEAKGQIDVGFAAASFRANEVGADDKSWAIYSNGKTYHK
jgi:hypothetical protein